MSESKKSGEFILNNLQIFNETYNFFMTSINNKIEHGIDKCVEEFSKENDWESEFKFSEEWDKNWLRPKIWDKIMVIKQNSPLTTPNLKKKIISGFHFFAENPIVMQKWDFSLM